MDKIALIDYTPFVTDETPEYLRPLIDQYNLYAGFVRPRGEVDKFTFFIGAQLPYTPPEHIGLQGNNYTTGFICSGNYDEYWEVEKAYNQVIKDLIDLALYKENEKIAAIDLVNYAFYKENEKIATNMLVPTDDN